MNISSVEIPFTVHSHGEDSLMRSLMGSDVPSSLAKDLAKAAPRLAKYGQAAYFTVRNYLGQ